MSDIKLSEPAYPDTLDAAKWAEAFDAAEAWQRERGDIGQLTEWFRAAIGAGYNAARPLEPDVFYASDGTTIEGADLREVVAHIKREQFKVVESQGKKGGE